jgi:peptide/nickel transport system substrate-binding protein
MKGGAYSYGHYDDLEALFAEQAVELDRAKRTELLHKIQRLLHERVVYAPIWQLAFINGQGRRVRESALGLIEGHAYSAPYEDVTINKN